jgi:hypothetical protein
MCHVTLGLCPQRYAANTHLFKHLRTQRIGRKAIPQHPCPDVPSLSQKDFVKNLIFQPLNLV